MDIETEKITAHELIGLIDSGEAYLFLERINHPDKYVLYHFFKLNDVTGVFFSFVYNDVLRIHISFNIDTIVYVDKIVDMIEKSIRIAKNDKVIVWLRNETKNLIEGLQKK